MVLPEGVPSGGRQAARACTVFCTVACTLAKASCCGWPSTANLSTCWKSSG